MQYLPSGKVSVFINGKWSAPMTVEEGQAVENAARYGADWREQLTRRIEEAAGDGWRCGRWVVECGCCAGLY